MRLDLAPRLLALPPTVRATLAGVPGPGWRIFGVRESGVYMPREIQGRMVTALDPSVPLDDEPLRFAWWPANPATAVAAVLDCTLAAAHESLMAWLDNCEDIEHPNAPGLDSDAALSIIEAHVARSQS